MSYIATRPFPSWGRRLTMKIATLRLDPKPGKDQCEKEPMRYLGSQFPKSMMRPAVSVLFATAFTAMAIPTAHASSGGGCNTNNQITACISASGDRLEPDLYVHTSSGCSHVSIWVDDETTSRTIWRDDTVTDGCAVGHHGPWALDSANTSGQVVNGHKYQATAEFNLVSAPHGNPATVSGVLTLSY
jgi:hypothetical protein